MSDQESTPSVKPGIPEIPEREAYDDVLSGLVAALASGASETDTAVVDMISTLETALGLPQKKATLPPSLASGDPKTDAEAADMFSSLAKVLGVDDGVIFGLATALGDPNWGADDDSGFDEDFRWDDNLGNDLKCAICGRTDGKYGCKYGRCVEPKEVEKKEETKTEQKEKESSP